MRQALIWELPQNMDEPFVIEKFLQPMQYGQLTIVG